QYLYEEANKWHTLSHENVLSFLGICRDIGPSPALILPFCQEGTVMKYLQRNSKTPVEKLDVVCVNSPRSITAIASGLEYLHSKDVVHGDLKAQNILVDKRGNPSICDFGISKLMGSRGFTTASVGTTPYMAPDEKKTRSTHHQFKRILGTLPRTF
ncbi:kinase-like domain-containing protein, partial [Mycena floridula]